VPALKQRHITHLSVGEKRIITSFLVVLLISFSPLKALAYFLPLLFIVLALSAGFVRPRSIGKIVLVVIALFVVSLMHSFLYPDFLWGNFFLALITFSSFAILQCDFSRTLSEKGLQRILAVTFFFILIQASLGILQGLISAASEGRFSLDGSVGDAVKGTINPTFGGDGTGSNQMFAILMSMFLMILFLTRSFFLKTRRWVSFAMIGLAWLFTSVLHTFFFFAAALLVTILLTRNIWQQKLASFGKMKRGGRVVARGLTGIAFFFLLLSIIFPENLGTIPHLIEVSLSTDPSLMTKKAVATYNTLIELPGSHSEQPLVGLGLGQYSSRAGLIMSGTYLGRDFFFGPQFRAISYELIYQHQEYLRDFDPAAGSTKFPYYSWLSLYGEFGAAGVFVVLLLLILFLRRLIRVISVFPSGRPLLIPVLFGSLYLAFLGFQDNYWEFTQAIFPPILLLKLIYNSAMTKWKQL